METETKGSRWRKCVCLLLANYETDHLLHLQTFFPSILFPTLVADYFFHFYQQKLAVYMWTFADFQLVAKIISTSNSISFHLVWLALGARASKLSEIFSLLYSFERISQSSTRIIHVSSLIQCSSNGCTTFLSSSYYYEHKATNSKLFVDLLLVVVPAEVECSNTFPNTTNNKAQPSQFDRLQFSTIQFWAATGASPSWTTLRLLWDWAQLDDEPRERWMQNFHLNEQKNARGGATHSEDEWEWEWKETTKSYYCWWDQNDDYDDQHDDVSTMALSMSSLHSSHRHWLQVHLQKVTTLLCL